MAILMWMNNIIIFKVEQIQKKLNLANLLNFDNFSKTVSWAGTKEIKVVCLIKSIYTTHNIGFHTPWETYIGDSCTNVYSVSLSTAL